MTKGIVIREEGYELSYPREFIEMAAVLEKHVFDQKLYTNAPLPIQGCGA
jgi:hypothetical protein